MNRLWEPKAPPPPFSFTSLRAIAHLRLLVKLSILIQLFSRWSPNRNFDKTRVKLSSWFMCSWDWNRFRLRVSILCTFCDTRFCEIWGINSKRFLSYNFHAVFLHKQIIIILNSLKKMCEKNMGHRILLFASIVVLLNTLNLSQWESLKISKNSVNFSHYTPTEKNKNKKKTYKCHIDWNSGNF